MGRPKKLTTADATNYKNKFQAENYDRLYPVVPKGQKAEYQAAADKAGISLNAFMIQAMDKFCYEIMTAEETPDSEGENTTI